MSLLEELKGLGVNTDEGLERFMQNASLYERMLGKFPATIKKAVIDADFDCNDYEEITETAHTIKGVTGNLSLTPLYTAYTEIVNLLRAKKPEDAKALLNSTLPIQNKIVDCIEKYI